MIIDQYFQQKFVRSEQDMYKYYRIMFWNRQANNRTFGLIQCWLSFVYVCVCVCVFRTLKSFQNENKETKNCHRSSFSL